MHGEEGRKGGRDGMGMRRQGCRGPPGTRRLEGEQCDSSRPARGLISGQEDGCGGGRWLWPREGQMVNDMTGFFFFFPLSSARGHAALIKSALPITSCPERKSSRGRGWCTKLMEDVTNHKIYDKSILSSNHANNLECVCVFFFF